MSLLSFSFGGSSFKLSWSDFEFLLVTASSAQLLAELSLQSSSGLPLDGGPVHILATEFNFTEKLARNSWGRGAARFVGQFQEMGGQSLGDLSRVQLECCE